jgi:hypothetical protein
MQLDGAARPASLRARLGAAVCVLLAAGLPAVAHAEPAATWRFEGTGLLYGEAQRTQVIEPNGRLTRLFKDGSSLSAQLGIDVVTGASPTGAMPSGQVQTTTTASGNVRVDQGNTLPTTQFKDQRASFDLGWTRPIGTLFSATTGGHFSREKDYQSAGGDATLSLDVMHRLATVTLGGSFSRDRVFPVGGIVQGLTDGTPSGLDTETRDSDSGLLGLSRVITRRWLLGVTASRSREHGYLTEPYKVVSLIDPATGHTSGALRERRPDSRVRSDVYTSSVYHLKTDVLYLSHRAYWDDWGVRSQTVDLRYRHELGDLTYVDHAFLRPHARWYQQTAADFFVYGLRDGDPLPVFATSDGRLGTLRTLTLGSTFGFHLPQAAGEWTVRAEYLRQWGDGSPASAIGAQRHFDLSPKVDTGALTVGYTVEF